MIALALQAIHILTKGDRSGATGKVKKGVPQGSPLCSTIFNVCMDTYMEFLGRGLRMMLGKQKAGKHQWSCVMFSDSARLQTKNGVILLNLLSLSDMWAHKSEMA